MNHSTLGSFPQQELPYQTNLTVTCNLSQGDVSVSVLYPHGWVPVHRAGSEDSNSLNAVVYSMSSNILLNIQVARHRRLRSADHGQVIVGSDLLRGSVRCPVLNIKGVPVALVRSRESHSSSSRSMDDPHSDFIGVDLDIEVFFDPMSRRRLTGADRDYRHGNLLLPRFKVSANRGASDEDKDRILLGKPARIEVIREANETSPAPGSDPHSPMRFYRF